MASKNTKAKGTNNPVVVTRFIDHANTDGRLRYEENSCFDHDLWDRFDFLSLLATAKPIAFKDDDQRRKFKYSLIQDCFYSLMGRPVRPIRNKTTESWHKIISSNFFKKCITTFQTGGMNGRVAAMMALSELIEMALREKPKPKPQPIPGKLKAHQPGIKEALENFQKAEQDAKDKPDRPNQDVSQGAENQPGSNDVGDEVGDQSSSSNSGSENKNSSQDGQGQTDGNQSQTSQQGNVNKSSQTGMGGQPQSSSRQAGRDTPQQGSNTWGTGSGVPIYKDVLSQLEAQRIFLEQTGEDRLDDPGLDEDDGFEFNDTILDQFQGEEADDKYLTDPEQYKEVLESLMPFVSGDTVGENINNTLRMIQGANLNVKSMAEFLGFTRSATHAAKAEGVAATGEMTQYKHVEWGPNLHPVDMAGLARNDPRTLARMAEGNLRQRVYKDKVPQGRGPVIVLRDESGSMNGHKDLQAKQLEISLATAFNEQDRELISMPWNDGQTRVFTYKGEKNKFTFEQHINNFLSGGTQIIHALRQAAVYAKEYVDGADILVITDGEIGEDAIEISKAAKEFKETYKGRIWLCYVGVSVHSDNRHKIWADGVIDIKNISQSQALYEMIQQSNTTEEGDQIRI